MKIEKLTIRGFRGILNPLEIPFVKGSNCTSCTLFGRNGTGKSSIADAWEWFQTGRVEHLSKEGAGVSSYPNRYMPDNESETWVEVAFRDPADTIRLSRDNESDSGDIETFRNLLVRSCQIRFSDLKEFVFQTKSEKFGALAKLMELEEQTKYQKKLEKAARDHGRFVESLRDSKETAEAAYHEVAHPDAEQATAKINALFKKVGVQLDDDLTLEQLIDAIADADFGAESKQLEILRAKEQALETAIHINFEDLYSFLQDLREFHDEQDNAVATLLLRLYDSGQRVLEVGEFEDLCPLCKQAAPELDKHLANELEKLEDLRRTRDTLESSRESVHAGLKQAWKHLEECSAIDEVKTSKNRLQALITSIGKAISEPPDKIDVSGVPAQQELEEALRGFQTVASETLLAVRGKLSAESEDVKEARSRLLAIQQRWENLELRSTRYDAQKQCHEALAKILEHYRADNLAYLEKVFSKISKLVGKYFAILESGTQGLTDAELVIDESGRAAYLSATLYDEEHKPAYRALSESQLNSFGLAVQLAIARLYNTKFKFLILDDVINSFDAYKRPRLVKLIREEFDDFQFLILTHDDVWRDRLYRTLDCWNRAELLKNPGAKVGARLKADWYVTNRIEAVRDKLQNDRPHEAGALLGPYLEGQLQTLCEAFEAEIKYSKRDSPSLSDLIIAVRKRVKKKLTGSHEFYEKLVAFEKETFFRNWTSHDKSPISSFAPEEVEEALEAWLAIEEAASCSQCSEYARYDKKKQFVCKCKSLVLQKPA